MPTESRARGTVVLCNDAGRSLRKQCASVTTSSVIDCCGEFRAGDTVHVSFRGNDGGQFAIATAVVGMDAAALREQIAQFRQNHATAPNDEILIAERDVKLLWPLQR